MAEENGMDSNMKRHETQAEATTSKSLALETEAGTSSSGTNGTKKTKEKEGTKTVPFYKLFTFAEPLDVVLMIMGTIGAIGNEVSCWMVTGERQAGRIRGLYLKTILRQDIGFFDKETNTGEVVGRMSGDTVLIQDAMGEKVGKFIQLLSTFLGGFVIAFVKGWLLTLVLLAPLPVLAIAGGAMALVISRMASYGQNAYAKAATIVEQTIGSIRTVASFTGEKQAVASPCMSAFAAGQAAAYKMFETIKRKPVIDASETSGKILDDIRGDIELRDVHFSYPARPDEQIFSGFSLSIPSGTTAALVGQSGSGKSTVISLIERFYDPQAGEVLIDGVNLKEFQLKWIRNKIGLVSQEPVLFTCSIKDNIAYGKDGASIEEIKSAAEQANAAKFIDKLPQGLDTMVGEHGTQLSGGQKQRVAIARAILKDPRILLLDEATSALDAESERVVQEALDRIMVNRTTVIVAHRLSTVRNADMIAVIQRGKIVEKGSHSELLKDPEGAFSQLIRLQEVNKYSEQAADQDKSGSMSEWGRQSSQRMSLLRSISRGSSGVGNSSRHLSAAFGLPTGLNVPETALTEAEASDLDPSAKPPKVSLRRLAYLNKPEVPVLILIRRIRSMCFEKVVHMEVSWFDEPRNSSGVIGSRLSADAASVRALVGDALAQVVQDSASAVAGLVIAFQASKWVQVMYEDASQVANDAVGSIRTVASFCAEEKVMELYREKCEGPLKNGIRQAPNSTKAKSAAASVFSMLDRKSKMDPSDESGTTLENVRGEIELRHISFKYPTRPDIQIFSDLSLTIDSGKTVALVGESGSGKSTVIALLQRFYDPDSGHITLDGTEIQSLQLKWLRQQMGLVSQEPVLFNDTIRANIAYGREGHATEAEILAASELANAHKFISGLQQGYDTIVGERGVQLSGGQKQRVAIARAIVKSPKILLLDEATSALDAESERVVQDALDRVMVNRTTVVVAHRLSTIKNADVIAVVKNGTIVEKGKHDNLIKIKDDSFSSFSTAIAFTSSQTSTKLLDDFFVRMNRKWKVNFNDGATGASDVGLNRFLDGLEGAVEDDDGVAVLESAFGEGATDVAEDDGGGGGGVVDDGDFVEVVGIDEVLDYGAGVEDAVVEVIEKEGVGLVEEFDLPPSLGGDDGRRAASEAAVVDSGDAGLVVSELGLDFGGGYER
ncbi:hypothetical protein HYC85_024749 [Camellia sinensis]|uniref:Uncharacterized protein n=1 Tax=Camellia sinensis TaxID=4442 RepID=A0A7J7G902_CAMSI|nr:hypothetical protein HYC85_024749 [Camellia sinensis]